MEHVIRRLKDFKSDLSTGPLAAEIQSLEERLAILKKRQVLSQDHEAQIDAAVAILANRPTVDAPAEAAVVAERAIPARGQGWPLGQQVELAMSGERGTVIGFANYVRQPPQFYVEYVTGDGRQVMGWFETESLQIK